MEQIILFIALTIILPLGLLLIFLEERPRNIILSCMCGVIACFTAYFVNTFVLQLGLVNNSNDYSIMIAPIVEELLKFLPLLLFSLTLKKDSKQTIAMSFALGVGFCIVENFFYLFNYYRQADIVWIIFRCIGTGLMHSMSSTLIGYGLFIARKEKALSIVVSLGSLGFAIMYHGLYNLLVASSVTQFLGLLIPLLSYTVVGLIVNKEFVKEFFEDDDETNKKLTKGN